MKTRLLLTLLLFAAACSGVTSQPTQRIYLTDMRAHYDFVDGSDTWDTFTMPGEQALFRVNDGALEGAVVANRGYIWSLGHNLSRDVAIQATVQQTQGIAGNGFGVMCRADADGNGYYFLISSSGYYSILKGAADQNDPIRLVDWQFSHAIHQSEESNELSAVCVENYLSLSVNGRFLAEVRDNEFDAGKLGVTLAAVEDTAWVRFDDIIIREAAIAG
jgi:hypothetical protein